jgi:phage-related protein (TIGR01555 family)
MVFGLGRTAPLEARIASLEGALTQRLHGWADVLSGFGDEQRDSLTRLGWDGEALLGRQLQEDLYQHSGVAAAIVDLPADDATRRWVDIRADNDALSQVDEALSQLPLRDGIHGRRRGLKLALNRALKLSRMTGGAALVVAARDGRMPWEPLDVGRLESIERLYVHHAWELWPHEFSPDGEVTLYQLAPDPDGSTGRMASNTLVHASRVWPFCAVELTPQRQALRRGWGDPVLQRVYRELKLSGFVEDQGARTVSRKNIPWFKTQGLADRVERDGGKALRMRLQIMTRAMSILKLIPLDASEDVGHLDASLSGIAELLDRYPYRVAAAARIPMTRLYGMSPGGMNATGESDIRLYYDMVDGAIIEPHVVPCVRWVADLVMRSARGPTDGALPERWTVQALPLWEASEHEQATVKKVQADTDAIYLDRGVCSPAQVAAMRGFEPVQEPNPSDGAEEE